MLKEEISILKELIYEAVPFLTKLNPNSLPSLPTENFEPSASQQESSVNYFSGKTLQEIPEISKSELYSSTHLGPERQEEDTSLDPTLSHQPPVELSQAISTIIQERSQVNYPQAANRNHLLNS